MHLNAGVAFVTIGRACVVPKPQARYERIDNGMRKRNYGPFAPREQVEQHMVDGELKTLLVHRKGATRAFPPHHPLIPVDYQFIGQPVIVGGTMGTCSYVLTGTQAGMAHTFGSTCHGAGRAKSRNESR